jgi:hypothetical protein
MDYKEIAARVQALAASRSTVVSPVPAAGD